VTDKDREAAAKLAFSVCDDGHCSLKKPCWSCHVVTRDIGLAIAAARAEGAAEEREAIESALMTTTRYDYSGDNGIKSYMGGDYMDVRETFAAIRARGEQGGK